MQSTQLSAAAKEPAISARQNSTLSWLQVAAFIYLLILAVGVIGSGFKWASGGSAGAAELFAFATNPFTGLIIGTLATALVQSSSTVTSIIVGLVAGGLPVSIAIPMVMGANIGTTVTNTLVSLGHVRFKEEFKRAFSAATVHDFFNLLAVAIFLPLEITTGFLEKLSLTMANWFSGGSTGVEIGSLNFIKPITKPVITVIQDTFAVIPEPFGGIVMILFGVALIFASITFLGKLLKRLLVGRAKEILHSAIGRGPIMGLTSGTLVTVLVQSSSTTTSLIVPLVGSGVFNLRQIYPFTLGANIGTTITALIAATAISEGNAVFALEIAMVHLMFNVCAVALIFGLPFLRSIPLICAEHLSEVASKRKSMAFVYILSVFFVIPGLIMLLTA